VKAKVTVGASGDLDVDLGETTGGLSAGTLATLSKHLELWLTQGGVLQVGVVKLVFSVTVQ